MSVGHTFYGGYSEEQKAELDKQLWSEFWTYLGSSLLKEKGPKNEPT